MLAYRVEPDGKTNKQTDKQKSITTKTQQQQQQPWRSQAGGPGCRFQQNLLCKSSEKTSVSKGCASPECMSLREDLATVALLEARCELGCVEGVFRAWWDAEKDHI